MPSKYDRIRVYMRQHFPLDTPKQDIISWAQGNIISWQKIPKNEKENIVRDWQYIQEETPTIIKRRVSFWERVKRWLRRKK